MGTCYSKKAKGGNLSYTTTHMASTKLEDASRLARPTPYARNENMDSGQKKGSLLHGKQSAMTNNDPGNMRSSIPRFSSSLPVSTSHLGEQKSMATCNDNDSIHVVNNNAVNNQRSASSATPGTAYKTPGKSSLNVRQNLNSKTKSCPDKIADSTEKPTKAFLKGSGISRTLFGRSSDSTSKLQQGKDPKTPIRNSRGPSPASKSPSGKGSQSRESLSDFDSGLGNSLNDKNKPEDSDTVKDLEQLELHDESPMKKVVTPNRSTVPKHPGSDCRVAIKAPLYKREPNGKWTMVVNEKHFGPETVRTNQPKPFPSPKGNTPKHSFKMNASDNIFSTYASYKGLLSYQKKSYKPLDNYKTKPKEKVTSSDNSPQLRKDSSSTPKLRRQLSQSSSSSASSNRSSNSTFYVAAKNNGSLLEEEEDENTVKEVVKVQNGKKVSSPNSVNSEGTENGGIVSPPFDRDFLIDDEISDQPGLTFGDPKSEESDVQSLQMAMSELHALQMSSSTVKKRTDSVSSYNSRKGRSDTRDSLYLESELGSSCSSIASDDLMLDYEKPFDGYSEGAANEGLASPMRKISSEDKITPLKSEKKIEFDEKAKKRSHRRSSGPLSSSTERNPDWRKRTVSLPLRPPRQMTISEADDGGLKLDSSSYRLLCQDLNGMKTMLLRLKSVLQEAETINPFDQASPLNLLYSLAQELPANPSNTENIDKKVKSASIYQENADLRQQNVLLQQQLEEKDKTIHLLQQQMTKYLKIHKTSSQESIENASTQTDPGTHLTSSVSADAFETLVTSDDVASDFERSFYEHSQDHDILTARLNKVVQLLDQPYDPSQSDC